MLLIEECYMNDGLFLFITLNLYYKLNIAYFLIICIQIFFINYTDIGKGRIIKNYHLKSEIKVKILVKIKKIILTDRIRIDKAVLFIK